MMTFKAEHEAFTGGTYSKGNFQVTLLNFDLNGKLEISEQTPPALVMVGQPGSP